MCKEVSEDVADLEEQIRQRMEEVRNTNIMIKSNYKLILDAVRTILPTNTLTQISLVRKFTSLCFVQTRDRVQLRSSSHWEKSRYTPQDEQEIRCKGIVT